jgi:hypothetical protein
MDEHMGRSRRLGQTVTTGRLACALREWAGQEPFGSRSNTDPCSK